MTRIAALLLAALAAASALPAQAPKTRPAITAADLRTRLFLISDDSMGGRESGDIADWKAAEYIASEFRRLGLEPAGEHGSYFQTVPLVRVKPAPETRVVVGGSTLLPGRDLLVAGRPMPVRQLSHVAVIYGGSINDSVRWAPADSIAGRAIILSAGPGPNGARPLGALGAVLRNPRFARAAVIAVAALDLLGPERVATLNAGRLTTDTTMDRAAVPTLVVTAAAAEKMLGRALAGVESGTPGLTLDGAVGFVREPVAHPARNVIAVLRGSDPKLRSQYVSLTAHNDHVGFDHAPVDHDSLRAFDRVVRPMGADSPNRQATPEENAKIRVILDSLRKLRPARQDSIRNGADDDGSGTASILEIAERMRGERKQLRRSILFVSHTGEEIGLVGSGWFTDHPTVPRDSIVGEIDQDMVGRGTAEDLPEAGPTYLEVVGAKRLSREFGEQLEAANAAQPKPFVFNYAYDAPGHPLQYYCRADHYNYARYSIPAVAFSRGEHLDYHQVTDEPQYIDYDDMARVSNMVHDAAMRIASMDHRPKLDAPKGDPHAVCRQ
ncbi:MAG: M28 family metallopeptidase [Bacillota bacterium]